MHRREVLRQALVVVVPQLRVVVLAVEQVVHVDVVDVRVGGPRRRSVQLRSVDGRLQVRSAVRVGRGLGELLRLEVAVVDDPGVREDLGDQDALVGDLVEHLADEVLDGLGERGGEREAVGHDVLVELLHVVGFEGHGPADHGEQEDAEAPDVDVESVVPIVSNDFRSNIGWSSSLLNNFLMFFDNLTNSKIANFNSKIIIN